MEPIPPDRASGKPASDVGPPARRRWTRWGAAGTGSVAFGLLLAVAIGRLSQQVPLNSDQASSVLEGYAMGHGNLLLSGWTLPSDSFVTSKLPLLALLEWVQGLTPQVVYEVTGLLGAGVVLAAVWLAGGRQRGLSRATAMLVTGALLTSQALLVPGAGNVFPSGAMLPAGSDHAGSLVLLLVAWLALQRAERAPAWLGVTWVALAAASVGDPLAAVVGGGAIAVAGALDLVAGRRGGVRWDAALVAVGVSSAVLAPLSWWGIRRLGGFTAAPLLGGGYGLPPLVSSLSHNLSEGGRALLSVFGADFLDQSGGAAVASSLLHLCGLALVVAVLAYLLRPRRWVALDAVSRVLALGMLLDAGAYLVGQQATNLTSARYLVPLLGFGAVLAGREGVPRLLALRPRLGLGLLALGAAYAGVFAAGAATVQPAAPPLAPVTAYLEAHGAAHGLATYWDANVVTLSTHGAVAVRSIVTGPRSVSPYLWHSTASWYDPGRDSASFVLLPAGDAGDRDAVVRVLGRPAETATVAGTTIMVWPGNILVWLSPP